MNVNVLYSHSTLRHERHTHIGGSTVSYWYIICWYFVSMLMHIFTPNMSVWGCSLWRDTGARTHSAFQCWWYICVNQHVHVFRPHPRISCPSSQLVHPVSTFYTCVPPLLLLLLVLEGLLSARGGDVQESPGRVGVELLLVTTQRPHIHHPHDLPLLRRGRRAEGQPQRDSVERVDGFPQT